ncbi:MAG TPA: head protein [Firmicutes bacterium]|nr:MAG: head protein [Candidatus Coatesbacteria bacterium]RLC44912.1 MAG: head protein [Candidatus Coatesbacteria bacterium]HEC80447.1 head protein [Bacillota bacterium]
MAIVSGDIPRLLEAGLKTIFFEAYEKTPVFYEKVATVVPSTRDREVYAWLGNLPRMSEWVDERIPKGLLEHEFTIVNKNWELSIAIDRNALEDDQYGQIKARVSQMGEEAARHIDELVFSLLADGFNLPCYDGQNFFDDEHQEGKSPVQSNKGTVALSVDSYADARAKMMRLVDDQNKPMGIVPDTIVVPPELEETARLIIASDYYPSGSSMAANPWKNSAELIVTPYLTGTQNWFLLCTSRAVKPLILQMRKEVEFNALEGSSERGFFRREYVYGAEARYNVGYGMWQFAYGSIVS